MDPESVAVEFARQIALETGTPVIITDVTEGDGLDPKGRPIVVNPYPPTSRS